jgi:allantoicase
MSEPAAASFTGLVDLAAENLGGKALTASDDFFAPAQNMFKHGRANFDPTTYTDRGKEVDGWESRRKRVPGHDYCIIQLGATGRVLGFDIDTQHFLGNHPPYASVDGLLATASTPLPELERGAWQKLLAQSPLNPGAQNLFAAESVMPVSHLRLNIYPDGGIARFRAYGRVQSNFGPADLDAEAAQHVARDAVDLAALRNGGLPLACSDAFFGPMHKLLLPGRAVNMSGGWETRRKRAPGNDWLVLQLGARGLVDVIELDTLHFKGNYPERCSIELIDAAGAHITELIASNAWQPLLPVTHLQAHHRHFFAGELVAHKAATHLRLNIFPDGGLSRLRVWGKLAKA